MPRIRTIKPEFFTSLTVADLPVEARLTFIGLWTHADDAGRCVDDPRLIKAALWPLDPRTPEDIERDLGVLRECSLIVRYQFQNRRYLAVRNWREHQSISKPSASKLPSPDEGLPVPPDGFLNSKNSSDEEHSRNTPGVLPEDSSRERKGKERNREGNRTLGQLAIAGAAEECETEAAPPALSEMKPDRFDEFWSHWPRKIAKTTARKAWQAAIKSGADAQRVINGAKAFAAFCEQARTEPRFIPHAATWLRAERWLDEPQPLARAAGDWQPYRNPTDPNAYGGEL